MSRPGRRGARDHEDAMVPTWWSWTELTSAGLPAGDVTRVTLDGLAVDLAHASVEAPSDGAMRFLLPAGGPHGDGGAVRLLLQGDGLRHLEVRVDGLATHPAEVVAVEHDGSGRLTVDVAGGVLAATADAWTPRVEGLSSRRPPYLHLRAEYLLDWSGQVEVDDLDLPDALLERIGRWQRAVTDGDRGGAAREGAAIAADVRRAWPRAVVTVD